MMIDRAAWGDAYKLHAAALEKLGQMEQEAFWDWMASQMIETSNAHGNSVLIMALLVAVFEVVETADKNHYNEQRKVG